MVTDVSPRSRSAKAMVLPGFVLKAEGIKGFQVTCHRVALKRPLAAILGTRGTKLMAERSGYTGRGN